ncbi:alpha/beta fold hydrolase [Nonomuraea sp. GTA35]|uniref:alpha/beta fold hydrolase n=1 Tax=Nonomuraea sp. GTA35 TaxID=1676746 RepID=UPI0035C1BE59
MRTPEKQIVLACTIDVENDLPSITVPTLVIAGEADDFVDLAHSVEPAGRIATAALPRLPDGHGVPHVYTTAVVQTITELPA